MQKLIVLLLLSASPVGADLAPQTETAVRNEQTQVHSARRKLKERTRELNIIEANLQKILSTQKSEFDNGLNALTLSSSERQDILDLYQAKDFKRLSTWTRKKLVQEYSRLAFDRKSWDEQFVESQTSAILNDINTHHEKIRQESYLKAKAESKAVGISLADLRENIPQIKKFCAALPKGGILHTHPYGTMDRRTVLKVLELFNPIIDRPVVQKYISGTTEKIHPREAHFLKSSFYDVPRSFLEIQKLFPKDADHIVDFFFVPRDTTLFSDGVTPFARFLAAFTLPLEMLGILNGNTDNQIALEKIIYQDMFLRSLEQRVSYMEITRNLPVLKLSRQFIDRYNELLHWTEEFSTITPRTLVSFNRTSLDTAEKRVQQIATMTQLLSMKPSHYVVGINLMGDESLVSALDASQFIYGKLLVENEIRSTGLQATMHAGELGDVKNLRDALVFGVSRVGHGILLTKNSMYLELFRREGVALELNLSSNDVLQVIPVARNPFLQFHRLGIPVSLSTDDEGMFLTDPNHECELAILETDIEYVELKQMMLNSLQTAFADSVLRFSLENQLQNEFKVFEDQWSTH
jgi:adenosine deaminase CECR1